MNKKIFITGAAGFVGSHLVPFLVNKGYYITAMVKNEKEKEKLGVTSAVVADLSKKGNWRKSLKSHEFIIHLASQISSKDPSKFIKNNVIATQNLIEAASFYKVKKIILFSSASVTSIREDMYSKTKKEQESIVSNSRIDCIIIRPSMIYGPGDKKNIGWLIKIIRALPIIPLPGGGKFGRQPVYVNDLCQIVEKLLFLKKHKKIYEVHGLEYVTMSEMVKNIIEVFNLKRITLPIPIFLLKIAIILSEKILPNPKFTSDQIDSLISGERFKGENWAHDFDIIPTKFRKGIEEMAKS